MKLHEKVKPTFRLRLGNFQYFSDPNPPADPPQDPQPTDPPNDPPVTYRGTATISSFWSHLQN